MLLYDLMTNCVLQFDICQFLLAVANKLVALSLKAARTLGIKGGKFGRIINLTLVSYCQLEITKSTLEHSGATLEQCSGAVGALRSSAPEQSEQCSGAVEVAPEQSEQCFGAVEVAPEQSEQWCTNLHRGCTNLQRCCSNLHR